MEEKSFRALHISDQVSLLEDCCDWTLSYPLTKMMNRVPKDSKVVIIKVILQLVENQWNLSENDFLSKISYLENNYADIFW